MGVGVVHASMTAPSTHTFVCPECRRSIEVDGAMRTTLLDAGCVVCGAPVTEEDIGGASAVG
jgi:transcription initiation factor IIE alpha subunit